MDEREKEKISHFQNQFLEAFGPRTSLNVAQISLYVAEISLYDLHLKQKATCRQNPCLLSNYFLLPFMGGILARTRPFKPIGRVRVLEYPSFERQ